MLLSYIHPAGPRFVLNLIRIFDGSFGGATLYENPHYVSPNLVSGISKFVSSLACMVKVFKNHVFRNGTQFDA